MPDRVQSDSDRDAKQSPHSTSTSAEEAKFQPPFAPTGTGEPGSLGSTHPHQGAEALVNAAAQHTVPEHPAPGKPEPSDTPLDSTESEDPHDDSGQGEEHPQRQPSANEAETRAVEEEEETPITKGTPLDEMKTPMLERGQSGRLSTLRETERDTKGSQESLAFSENVAVEEPEEMSGPSPSPIETKAPNTEDDQSLSVPQARRRDTSETLRPKRSIPKLAPPMDPIEPTSETGASSRGRSRTTGAIGQPPAPAVREVTEDFGSVRMGASALISALNALPWDGDESDGVSSDEEPEGSSSRKRETKSSKVKHSHKASKPVRPRVSRMHSSLHTIRPMAKHTVDDDMVEVSPPSKVGTPSDFSNHLHFPFRENTIARRARSPGQSELAYQFAEAARRRKASLTQNEVITESGTIPAPKRKGNQREDEELDQDDDEAEIVVSPGIEEVMEDDESLVRDLTDDRVAREEGLGDLEQIEEIGRAAEGSPEAEQSLQKVLTHDESVSDVNTGAALREGKGEDEMVEERMASNMQEKKRVRREKLSEKLMEVFGLEEREEVLEEMKCWLLRSVMLKGYMYLTPKHICFFAHMPDRENVVVKTGPLHKRASRTKMHTKYWVVLKNDVLSWYESTADPYFPKGNVSLQYASSCDVIDETRFKLRTSERNYTFIAETEKSRDEWIKAIKKVMFKTQHEGECVKLIIPTEAVLDIDKAPTLEFAETIEIKCVDSEDQMSIDSYFFACFHDGEQAFASIRRVLDNRPDNDLPRVTSSISLAGSDQPSGGEDRRSLDDKSKSGSGSGSGPLGIKKLGSVLKPIVPHISHSGDSDPEKGSGGSGFNIPFISRQKPSHDSLETLRTEAANQPSTESIDPLDEDSDGYPPRQSGPPPHSLGQGGKGWGQWIKKPASKIFSTSPGSSSSLSLFGRTPPGSGSNPELHRYQTRNSSTTSYGRRHPRKQSSVTEVVEPAIPTEEDEGDDEMSRRGSGVSQKPRLSWQTETDLSDGAVGGGYTRESGYSIMERSESGTREDEETVKKFRSVFSLNEKEELIDHFPGWLYRVLPVSGRFFVSTNYFCFRSSQLLYKTKMIVPIRDLYGLKAQKAFRFGHSGLIVVIKGHEELFLEFSSSKRRRACVALLEERMEAVRLQSSSSISIQDKDDDEDDSIAEKPIATRIMEDLDESMPISPRGSGPAVSPSPMFGSTTSTFLEFKPDPMTITCLTIGSRGDVQPYIALCKGLQAEGHRTRIATHGEYKAWVEGHGIEFASVGGDPAELMQMCVDNGMFTVSFLKEGLQKFRGWLDDLLNSSWEACQGSDLLIESPSAMGGIHIAEALRIPYYRAFTMPWTRTRAYPHAFAVPEHKRGGSYNYMTYTMFDQVFWRAISGQINRWRKTSLGIETTTFDKLEQHKVPFLYNFSPNVVPPPLDWTEWIHVTGYWFLENADESSAQESAWEPPKGLLEFIDNAHNDGKKVVYIGFGSIVVSDPEAMTRCVVEAVVDSGVCAILSKGWSDRGSKARGEGGGDSDGADGIKYPPEIFSIDSIDHTWLFPRIDAACHHGGAGTSGASLRAGIPTIIKPFFGDQAFWSERVESLNVGSAVRKLTVSHLADALRVATTDEKQIAKAKVVGEMIRKENGVARAIEAIYRDLEYAKSLIKAPPIDKSHSKTNTSSSMPTNFLQPITTELSRLSLTRSRSPRSNKSRSRSGSSSQPEGEAEAGAIPSRPRSQVHSRTPSASSVPSQKTTATTTTTTTTTGSMTGDSQPSSNDHSRATSYSRPGRVNGDANGDGNGNGNGDASDTSSWDILSDH